MYDPDTNATFLDLSDPDKFRELVNLRRMPKETHKLPEGTLFSTQIREDTLREVDKRMNEVEDYDNENKNCNDLIPLAKMGGEELGVRLSDLKFVIRKLFNQIYQLTGKDDKATQTTYVSSTHSILFPQSRPNNANSENLVLRPLRDTGTSKSKDFMPPVIVKNKPNNFKKSFLRTDANQTTQKDLFIGKNPVINEVLEKRLAIQKTVGSLAYAKYT